MEDASTLLKPFWDASGTTFWNSTRVKSTVPFGYAYPETQSWNFPTAQAYQASLTSSVTRQYGGNVLDNFVSMIATPAVQPVAAVHAARKAVVHEVQQPLVAQTLKKAPVVTVVPADLSKDNILEAPPASSPTVPPVINAMLQEKKYTEWITNIRTTKHGLGQTYRVFVLPRRLQSRPSHLAIRIQSRRPLHEPGPRRHCRELLKMRCRRRRGPDRDRHRVTHLCAPAGHCGRRVVWIDERCRGATSEEKPALARHSV